MAAMRAGNYLSDAAKYGGVGYSTVKRWIKWGHPEYDPANDTDAKNPPPKALAKYRTFRAALEAAEASAIVEAVAELRAAGKKDWRAAEAFLKRRASATWGTDHVAVDHSGEVAMAGPVLDALAEYADVLHDLAAPAPTCTCLPGMADDEYVPGCPTHDPETGAHQ